MTPEQEEWERQYRERQRLEQIEATGKANENAIKAQAIAFDDKIDKLAHGLVDQMSDRWEDKVALFETRALAAIEKRLAAFADDMVTKKSLPEHVEAALEAALHDRRDEVRGTFKFWAAVVLNTASITAGIATAIFWAVNFLKS
jgi:hypothetical protein